MGLQLFSLKIYYSTIPSIFSKDEIVIASMVAGRYRIQGTLWLHKSEATGASASIKKTKAKEK